MANEITLTSGEQYRPAMLLENGQAARIQRQRRRRLPWRSSVSNTVWQEKTMVQLDRVRMERRQ